MSTQHLHPVSTMSGGDEADRGELRLSDLSEITGVPPRTIRLYIARGLLPGPLRRGRDAAYGREHLERLRAVQRLQRQGLTLQEIAGSLGGAAEAAPLSEQGSWQGFSVAPDVMVLIRGDQPPWRRRQVRAAVARLAEQLGSSREGL